MRGSKRIGCPMKLKLCAVRKSDPKGEWAIVHHKKGSSIHNHLPSRDARIHAFHRRRSAIDSTQAPVENIHDFVRAQTAAGVAVANIHASILATNADSMVISKDLANSRHASRQQDMATRTPMEALFDELRGGDFFFRYTVQPSNNQIRHLFWAHPATTALYSDHPDVLILDCTYKTNRYNIPLLNIIAMTSLNTALPVAQCWLPGEVESDFVWALITLEDFIREHHIGRPNVFVTDRDLTCRNALLRVFPSTPALICHWHMHRNVLSKTRQVLGQVPVEKPAPGQDRFENSWETSAFMETYYQAVYADSESLFEVHKAELISISPLLASYLDRHWWKFKTSIVVCWIKSYPHYGYISTSAVEGTHAKCKRWLQNSRGDLYTVFLKLRPWWQSSAKALSLLTERSLTITPYRLQAQRYSAVVRIVTIWALKATDELWKKAEDIVFGRLERSPCSGSHRTVHGRPCVHELIKIVESNGQLKLLPAHFDQHWHIKRSETVVLAPRIEEPAIIRTNSRRAPRSHRSNHGIYGTGRHPISSERVDLNHPASPPRVSRRTNFAGFEVNTDGELPAFGSLIPTYDDSISHPMAALPDTLRFEEPFAPAQTWGFASSRPFE